MLRSMTGFGAAADKVDGVEYSVEIRSVNNRYFKAITKLPESWAQAETDIERMIREQLKRGTVTVTVRMRLPDEEAACRVNQAALNRYLDQIHQIEAEGDPIVRVDLVSLLLLPGVCEPPSMEDLCQRTRAGLMDLVTRALDALGDMRTLEGQALKVDLLANCDMIQRSLQVVAEAGPRVVDGYSQRLSQRVGELIQAGNVKIDEAQLAREVAIFAERCDVAEEVTRLGGHLSQFRETIDAPEPAGRKLDFIAQEMLREANTIASKANSIEIGRAVVEIKTAIDRIKEQAQNVE